MARNEGNEPTAYAENLKLRRRVSTLEREVFDLRTRLDGALAMIEAFTKEEKKS